MNHGHNYFPNHLGLHHHDYGGFNPSMGFGGGYGMPFYPYGGGGGGFHYGSRGYYH